MDIIQLKRKMSQTNDKLGLILIDKIESIAKNTGKQYAEIINDLLKEKCSGYSKQILKLLKLSYPYTPKYEVVQEEITEIKLVKKEEKEEKEIKKVIEPEIKQRPIEYIKEQTNDLVKETVKEPVKEQPKENIKSLTKKKSETSSTIQNNQSQKQTEIINSNDENNKQ